MKILLLNNIITTAISEILFVFQRMSGCLLKNKSVQNLQNILPTVLPIRAVSVDIQKDREFLLRQWKRLWAVNLF